MKDKDVMILLGVVGVLYMAKASTTTTSHEERITADGIEFARQNAASDQRRNDYQTIGQRVYANLSSWTTWSTPKHPGIYLSYPH